MPRASRAAVAAALLGAAWLPGCSSPTGASSSDAEVTLSAPPANAQTSSGRFYIVQGDANNPDRTLEYPFQSTFTVTLSEGGGAGVDITAISLKIQQATNGIITPPTNGQVEYYEFVSSASASQLPSHGTASVGFQAWYALPNKSRECVATVSVSFIDRKGTADDTSDDVGFAQSLNVQIR
jgi:hypothetical protein